MSWHIYTVGTATVSNTLFDKFIADADAVTFNFKYGLNPTSCHTGSKHQSSSAKISLESISGTQILMISELTSTPFPLFYGSLHPGQQPMLTS
jgi:hypothetical protein